MKKTFYTSDPHYGHARIIDLCARPFANVDDMDNAMIERHNAKVGWDDDVWCLGDFTWHDERRASEIFGRLKGRKHLVLGNHDPEHVVNLPWESVSQYVEHTINGVGFVLFHYPIQEWHGFFKNSGNKHKRVHLHGHIHSTPTLPKYAPIRGRLDVGVDNMNFEPVSAEEVLQIINGV